MAKVAILNDYEAYAAFLAGPLIRAGHAVMLELGPIDFERVLHFGPDVVSLGLYRKKEAFDRPIANFEADVVGYKPLADMERYPAISALPLILIATGLREKDVPTTLNYNLFLSFPDDLELYVAKVEELATKVKTRRRISGYVCPCCGSRFVYIQRPQDLFCPRCGTTVEMVDKVRCLVAAHGVGPSSPCTIAELEAPAPDRQLFQKEVHIGPEGTSELYPGTGG